MVFNKNTCCPPSFGPDRPIFEQRGQRIGDRGRIVGREQGARFAVLDQLAVPADVGRGDELPCAIASSGFSGVTRSVSRIFLRG